MIFESIRTGLKNLWANKLRSTLSALGIIFGVGTLVATMSIGEGTRRQILSTIEALGSNLIMVDSEYTVIRRGVMTPGLLLRDVELLEQHSTLIELIAPLKREHGIVSFGGKQIATVIYGTDQDYESIFNFYVERGRFLMNRDVEESARVCVVGADIAEKFEVDDILGRVIYIKDGAFVVIGEMERLGKSQRRTFSPDVTVIIPYTAAKEISSSPERADQIIIKSRHASLVEEAKTEIENLLMHFHGIKGGNPDFSIWTQEELLRRRQEYTRVFQIALGSIAMVSLLIGGIGIMNILLASVNERIKEIGVRKALGANPLDILLQFLFESFILTVSGGIVGIFLGKTMGARIAPLLTEHFQQKEFTWQAVTSTEIVIMAFIFAVVTGFIFGLYPALKASRLDPSEALTYE